MEQQPDTVYYWGGVAYVLAADDKRQAYKEHCGRMRQQFEDPKSDYISETIVRTCLLLPDSTDPNTLPVKQFTRAIDNETVSDERMPLAWSTRALLAYRRGEPKLAVQYVAESEKHEADKAVHCANLSILAMAQCELELSEQSRQTLQEAKTELVHLQAAPATNHLLSVLALEIMTREAEAAVEGTKATK